MRSAALIISTCLLFSACSTIPRQSDLNLAQQNANWLTHKSALEEINHWQFRGRFSAQTDTESWHGSINWSQKGDQFIIHVAGPLSSGSFSLQGDSNTATLALAKNKNYEAQDAELLLETHTGMRLPIKKLRYWIVGLPSPRDSNSKITLNEEGLLEHLSQKNWEISFKKYRKMNNIRLPKKIFIENPELDVRLVIKNWEILS